MNLCIDWGNTRVKAGIFDKNTLIKNFTFSDTEAENGILEIVHSYRPTHTIISSVVNDSNELISTLQSTTQLTILTENTSLPFMNAYTSSNTLGMDRVALSAAANTFYPNQNCLIISIGTAITYNFMNEKNIFRGGAISPGLKIRFNSLHNQTDQLPQVNETGEVLLLGYDTKTCIRSGVIYGMAFEIDGMINAYKSNYSNLKVIITGGDAPLFEDKIKNQIFADSFFLLKGLNSILQHNAR